MPSLWTSFFWNVFGALQFLWESALFFRLSSKNVSKFWKINFNKKQPFLSYNTFQKRGFEALQFLWESFLFFKLEDVFLFFSEFRNIFQLSLKKQIIISCTYNETWTTLNTFKYTKKACDSTLIKKSCAGTLAKNPMTEHSTMFFLISIWVEFMDVNSILIGLSILFFKKLLTIFKKYGKKCLHFEPFLFRNAFFKKLLKYQNLFFSKLCFQNSSSKCQKWIIQFVRLFFWNEIPGRK